MAAKPDPSNGICVLGIDAAWTAHHPSGVALVQRTTTGWSCLAVATSYEAFIAQASGRAWDPGQKATGSRPDPATLLQASQQLTGIQRSAVCRSTCPWPPHRSPAVERRTPPSPAERPGAIADQLRADFAALGYPLHTSGSDPAAPALIECYPHVALLALLQRDYRVPYKVSRSGQSRADCTYRAVPGHQSRPRSTHQRHP